MANLDKNDDAAASPKHEQQHGTPPPLVVPTAPPAAAAAADVESQAEPASETGTGTSSGFGVAGIVRRWKRDDLLKKSALALRGMALIFTALSFIIMVTNEHGDWKDFDNYQEFRYLVGIATLATLYTGIQAFTHFSGKQLLPRRTSALADFIGDQIMAYLLMSAASAAIPMTNRMRESQDNIFTDALASSISMAFLAFVTLALSAVISGHKISSQSYI